MTTVASEADIKTEFKDVVKFYDEARKFAAVNATNLVSLHSTFLGNATGTLKERLEGQILSSRGQLAGLLGGAKDAIETVVRDYSRTLTKKAAGFDEAFAQVYRDYAENAKRVKSRGLSFGTPSAGGSNVGSGGTLNVLHTDSYGFTIENCYAEAKLARCTRDAASKAKKHQEAWTIEGAAAGRDALEELGSGRKSEEILALSAADSERFGLRNPSFSSASAATATPTSADIPNWTITDTLGGSALTVSGTNFELRTGDANDEYYRGFDGDATLLALRCKANAWCLSQDLQANGGSFDAGTPYYFHVAVCRRSSADGTLTFRVGGSTVTLDITSLTNDVWYVLKITLGSKNWYRTFGASGLTLSLARAGGSTGNVDVDDFTIGAFTFFDGSWFAFVGGPTPWEFEDTYTWTDTEYASAINQNWLRRGPGVYLPSCPSTPTAAPTAALAGAGAGNVDNGAHRITKVWVDVNGIESGESSTVDVTVVDKTSDGKVTIGRNESSPGSHIAYWRIYTSKAGVPGTRYFLADVAVGTSSYTYNTADASLSSTTAPTHSVTLDDPS